MECACCMEPATDETPGIDLCSEATGANDGRAWKIKRCSLHAAAPGLLAALRQARAALISAQLKGAELRHAANAGTKAHYAGATMQTYAQSAQTEIDAYLTSIGEQS